MTHEQAAGADIKAAPLDIDQLVTNLGAVRKRWRTAHRRHAEIGSRGFPSRQIIETLMADLCGALFPMRLGPAHVNLANEDHYVATALRKALGELIDQIGLELSYSASEEAFQSVGRRARQIVHDFAATLPSIRTLIDTDVEAAYAGDPAARSVDEVLLCYPCVQAVIHYRLANRLHRLGAPLVARIITEIANSRTGIDIHPGARIGRSFFIDHGTGVVIGETAVVGDRVRIYQAVTLGARSFPADDEGTLKKGLLRHPVIEDDVIIYAGATILGRVTIGRGSIIGGNIWLTSDVPPHSLVHQADTRHMVVSRPGALPVPPVPEPVS